jgi:hypothetical protein
MAGRTQDYVLPYSAVPAGLLSSCITHTQDFILGYFQPSLRDLIVVAQFFLGAGNSPRSVKVVRVKRVKSIRGYCASAVNAWAGFANSLAGPSFGEKAHRRSLHFAALRSG